VVDGGAQTTEKAMSTSTFSGPIKSGTVREGAGTNTGTVITGYTATVAFGDTAAKTAFIIPANSQIVDATVAVVTAFDDTTTNTIDVGTSTTSGLYLNDVSVATAGLVTITTQADAGEMQDVGTSDVTVTLLFNGGDAAAGEAQVTLHVIQG